MTVDAPTAPELTDYRLTEAVGQLDRGNATVEIGQCEEYARQKYDEHQHV